MIRNGSFPATTASGSGASGGVVRQIFLAREETQECAALFCDVIADGAPQHRVFGLDRVEDGCLRHRAFDFDLHFVPDVRQRAKMLW